MATTTSTPSDPTFTAFTQSQAASYAQNRGQSYPPEVYDAILKHYAAAPQRNAQKESNLAASRDTAVLDVGTGPGKVVFDLLPHFAQGYGCDASEAMIAQAKRDAEELGVAAKTRFVAVGAEKCDECVEVGRMVGVVTVAMAAHWFDMPAFYASVAKVLEPGGTLAMWTCSSNYVHPSEPNHAEIQQILFDLEDGMLGPYAKPGNLISRHAYEDLLLPWEHAETRGLFEETSFSRVDWDRGGVPSAAPLADGTPGPFLIQSEESIDEFVAAIGSASMVIRWREAHPEKAHTAEDPVEITARKLRAASSERRSLSMAPSVTLLLLRRAGGSLNV